jgi:3'-5' exoribonuclease
MAGRTLWINTLTPGVNVNEVFLVRDKDLRTTKKGDLYVVCTLADRTGTLSARMWQASESVYAGIPEGGFLRTKGRTEDYRGQLQFVIDACQPVPAERVDLADFLATTERDVEEMWTELLEALRGIKSRPLRLLIKKFLEDRDLVAAFKRSPAAMQMHHPFIGGLLEHTLNIARAAEALLPLYPELNADLVRAGVFLHDIGKTAELSAGTAVNYTDRGQLVGHITMAAVWVEQKAALVAEETGEPIPPRLVNVLQHIILSHHGVHEYGSPKLPALPEAYFLHYLDNLDAKMFMTTRAIAADPDAQGAWTSYQRELGTRLYKHSNQLEPEKEGEPGLFE